MREYFSYPGGRAVPASCAPPELCTGGGGGAADLVGGGGAAVLVGGAGAAGAADWSPAPEKKLSGNITPSWAALLRTAPSGRPTLSICLYLSKPSLPALGAGAEEEAAGAGTGGGGPRIEGTLVGGCGGIVLEDVACKGTGGGGGAERAEFWLPSEDCEVERVGGGGGTRFRPELDRGGALVGGGGAETADAADDGIAGLEGGAGGWGGGAVAAVLLEKDLDAAGLVGVLGRRGLEGGGGRDRRFMELSRDSGESFFS